MSLPEKGERSSAFSGNSPAFPGCTYDFCVRVADSIGGEPQPEQVEAILCSAPVMHKVRGLLLDAARRGLDKYRPRGMAEEMVISRAERIVGKVLGEIE